LSRDRVAGVHGHRARALGRASLPGVSDLRARLAGTEGARHARALLSVAREVRGDALRIRAGDADRTLGVSSRIHRRQGWPLVDDRARHSVLAPHRTSAADHSGDDRPQLLRAAGTDERPAALAAARRTPFVL